MKQRQFQEIFLSVLPDFLNLKEEAKNSLYMDLCPIQDSFRYRARRLALAIANRIIDEKGELDQKSYQGLKTFFTESQCILGPGREGDSMIYAHLRKCLNELESHWAVIKKFSTPLCHKKAEEIIRDTLWPEAIRTVQTVHVRKAVLAAWLTWLRQTTGSCFATAPAILIQQNAPYWFFKDLYDLLTLGQMKRTVEGKEYAVPLSLNWGMGDLQRAVLPHLESSPGLKTAFEAAGVSQPVFVYEPTVEKTIRTVLLQSCQLTEDDLKDEAYLARIQMTPLLAKQTAVYYQRPSERALKVSDWHKRFNKACTAFRTFNECALLRSWEYTLASFCDVKTEFSRWNLYFGLGLQTEGDGIGAFLYAEVDQRLQRCNQEVARLHAEYEQMRGSMRGIELLFNEASSASRRDQLKADLQMQMMAADGVLEMRDREAEKAEAMAQFFPQLLQQYDQKLQEAFQELFDPSLLGDEAHLQDDSPAGFRLVYKHRRTDASQWSPIDSEEQYIDSLRDFFSSVEAELVFPPPLDLNWISDLTTALIRFIQEPRFIDSAKRRSQEKGRRSPWDYISGGTMQSLLQSYCNRDRPFTESKKIIRSETELLRFLVSEGKEEPILMHSPTHAFIYYPKWLPKNGEALIEENSKFAKQCEWDEPMQEHIAHRLSELIPELERALFLHLYRQKSKPKSKEQFRLNLIESMGAPIKNWIGIVDSVLFDQARVLTSKGAKKALEEIFQSFGKRIQIDLPEGYFGLNQIYQEAKSVCVQMEGKAIFAKDWDLLIVQAMKKWGLMSPHTLLFADTNWSGWFFGFVTHCVTGQLELWRLNRTATQGFPMSDWKEWMSDSNNTPWILLSQPGEYKG